MIKVNNVKISSKVNLSLKKCLENQGELDVVYPPSAVIKIHSCNPTQVVSNSLKCLSKQMPRPEDDKCLYLAGHTHIHMHTIKPVGKISIHEDCT